MIWVQPPHPTTQIFVDFILQYNGTTQWLKTLLPLYKEEEVTIRERYWSRGEHMPQAEKYAHETRDDNPIVLALGYSLGDDLLLQQRRKTGYWLMDVTDEQEKDETWSPYKNWVATDKPKAPCYRGLYRGFQWKDSPTGKMPEGDDPSLMRIEVWGGDALARPADPTPRSLSTSGATSSSSLNSAPPRPGRTLRPSMCPSSRRSSLAAKMRSTAMASSSTRTAWRRPRAQRPLTARRDLGAWRLSSLSRPTCSCGRPRTFCAPWEFRARRRAC